MLYLLTSSAEPVTMLSTILASIVITAIICTKEKRNDPERA